MFGTLLLISGMLGSISAVPVEGVTGPFAATATIDAATGKVVGRYSGSGRNPP
ncbi:hypothetical protein [Massilia psychrophila]|uniref:hypothetical protein n=1 Tax=Massilia psychrophila TaxID=1603353 RepID=UPI0015D4C530|nr:hypothetical protein [Massilia psychrophila]GGE90749.1 hypothetical protein GCM10008020_39610 [Massilia psychrophila]